MERPDPSEASWGARMWRALSSWTRRWLPVAPAPVQVLDLSPPCSDCGAPASRVVLTEHVEGWRLAFEGVAGSGNGGADPISDERARTIREALSPPYASARIRAAGFYDDFGFCIPCERFYCPVHWQVSSSGGGTCPAGHFKSLDPHWHPAADD